MFGVLAVLLLLALATHPELRLLVPFIDAVGLDTFLLLMGVQAASIASIVLRPVLLGIWGRATPLLLALDRLASSGNPVGSILALCGRILGDWSGCLGQYAMACLGKSWRLACSGPGNRCMQPQCS